VTAYRPISDYALIGDCRSAALISADGSIDWACSPRFDSSSVFGALLDARQGGFFRIRPSGQFSAERRYVPETNVVQIAFHCETGDFVLRDLMPVASEEEKRRHLTPDQEILREIEVTGGEVTIEIDYEPRPDYGRAVCALEDRGRLGIWLISRHGSWVLMSDVELTVNADGTAASARVTLAAGERRYASFSFSDDAPAVVPALGVVAREKVERSIEWWREWSAQLSYAGPYRDIVLRSCLVLKLMAFAPSGAIIAAPTASLPEHIGGVRNWDYRYCWLRDAAFTMRALFNLNYRDEAQAFLDWTLHSTLPGIGAGTNR
jgi:GH15 family glucan-1,4-alpha-glucosidase